MKFKLRITKKARLSKNDFNFYITPTIWILHNSTESRIKLAIKNNKKYTRKIMYKYTSLYLSWFVWSLVITIGKQ